MLQSMDLQRAGHNWASEQQQQARGLPDLVHSLEGPSLPGVLTNLMTVLCIPFVVKYHCHKPSVARPSQKPINWSLLKKTAKWLPGEALQIAVKRREVKSKGEKENIPI